MSLQTKDFDYELPPARIAQRPTTARDGGRLLVLDRHTGSRMHGDVRQLPDRLPPRSLLIVNDTRVFPARLRARRRSGGAVELLLLERLSEGEGPNGCWRAMVRSSKRLRPGETLELSSRGRARATIGSAPEGGRLELQIDGVETFAEVGEIPLPPYIQRPIEVDDQRRYQTVYAEEEGSVAAPTAGLHFSRELIAAVEGAGHQLAPLTLHVGPGTFVPVRVDHVDEHRMERERYDIPRATASAITAAREAGRPIIAVGTTSARALEASEGRAGPGSTELFIRPGYRFKVIDGLMTNFHLPRSTLLMLVSALAGREAVLEAYSDAVACGYRFYSYGDAMLVR